MTLACHRDGDGCNGLLLGLKVRGVKVVVVLSWLMGTGVRDGRWREGGRGLMELDKRDVKAGVHAGTRNVMIARAVASTSSFSKICHLKRGNLLITEPPPESLITQFHHQQTINPT